MCLDALDQSPGDHPPTAADEVAAGQPKATVRGAAEARVLGVAGSHQLRQAMEVHVAPIDPRDQSWEVPQPAYRVYFHNARGASYEYEVSGADV